ncbi:MAG: flagellar filament capping protein FliD [Lachnospiraceae bacterium]|nr:flagellar filament capping protein FliD [Lachnospiraceae bacterium]
MSMFNSTTNYSSLFSSLGGGAGSSNFLADYASIKNGSYGRLMKSYYGTVKSAASGSKSSSTTNVIDKILEEKKNPKVSKEAQEANAKLTTGLSNLRSTVSALQSDKTYKDTADGSSAADKVTAGIKEYVANYNDVVQAAKNSTLSNKTAYVSNMMSSTAANADKLAEIGITVDSSGTLRLDEAKLKEAGTSKVQELFSSKDIMSYGSVVASRLQFAGSATGTDSAADSTGTTGTAASSAASLKTDSKALASDELYQPVKDKDGNETAKYDIEKILATAKSFVSNYNKMFDKAESSTNSGVLANLSYIRETTARNADTLKQFGFNVDAKGRMTIDEDTFKKADMSKVQNFFKDYGSSVATNASLVDYYMTTQANATSGYTAAGTYNVQGSSLFTDFM